MKIALVSGFWGQNIGNAFFNIGGKWILENAFPEATVNYVQDQPGYRTFNNQSKGNPVNDWGMLEKLDVDLVVIEGPIFTENLGPLWENTLKAYKQRGIRWGILGAALFRHSEKEMKHCKELLEKYPPIFFSSRDPQSYDFARPIIKNSHSGIDSAFFAPRAYKPFNLDTRKYVAVNFDRWPEPKITVDSAEPRKNTSDFTYNNKTWHLDFPNLQMKMSDKNKWWSYIGSFLDYRKLSDEIDGLEVVRPEHRVNPHITPKVYKRRNAIASDEPWTYFTVYANAELTVSDRVHACVATLAYGGKAILFTPSPRARLFEALGLGEIRNKVVSLAPEILAEAQESELNFLRNIQL